MKRLKGLLVFGLIFISSIILTNTKFFAEEIQYTDNVIPRMTSNTSPSGVASASSVYDNTKGFQLAYLAFDRSTSQSNWWGPTANNISGWLEYDFKTDKCITKYTIQPRDWAEFVYQSPRDWTFEAWDVSKSSWVILDTQKNITNWAVGYKKEFKFTNNKVYQKYRLNVSMIVDKNKDFHTLAIGELEMMETITTPVNLNAEAGNKNIQLSWSSVINAQYYKVKRSTTPGGPYDTIVQYEPIVTGSAITFVDNDVTPGTTYYYVVSAIVSGTESSNSNEASATPTEETTPPDHTGNTATLILTMTNGDDKLYNVSLEELDTFLTWYDNRSNGEGRAYYTFIKTTSIAPYLSVKEYVSFDKMSSFEVKEYNQ